MCQYARGLFVSKSFCVKKYMSLILAICLLTNTAFAARGKKCFQNRRTQIHAWQMGKIVDTHLKLKKKGNFRMYRSLLGITRMDTRDGRYEKRGDTLLLRFCPDADGIQATQLYIIDCEKRVLISTNDDYPDLQIRSSKKKRGEIKCGE